MHSFYISETKLLISGWLFIMEVFMQIEYKRTADLIPYINNPRFNDEAVEYVANSIKEFGFKVPIIIDKHNEIIAGHTRLKASQQLGLNEVPVIVADDLTDEQVRAFRLADNKVTELSEWNTELLKSELLTIDGIDMTLFNFEDFDLFNDSLIENDDYEPEEVPEPVAESGDIYQLGNHRLMCGDSTDSQAVDKLMAGATVDLLCTDPPYNSSYKGGGNNRRKEIKNDSQSSSDFSQFITDFIKVADTHLKDGGAFYIWYMAKETMTIRKTIEQVGWYFSQLLIWIKDNIVLSRLDYQPMHELCMYGWKQGTHYFTDDRTQKTVVEDRQQLKKMTKKELISYVKQLESERNTAILREDKPLVSELHPTTKPLKMIAKLICNSTRKGELVFDPFGGSGTTLMACEQLGRKCYTMELDREYVDVIINRWEEYTGQKAVKLK